MSPSVQNLLAKAGLMSVPFGYATGVSTATSPVTVSPLGNAPRGLSQSVVSSLNSQLAQLAQQHAGANPTASSLGDPNSLVGTTQAPALVGKGMGFPAVEGVSPGLTAAPAGPTQGSPSMIGPAGPNGPSVAASNADGGAPASPSPSGNSLAQAATTLAQQDALTAASNATGGIGSDSVAAPGLSNQSASLMQLITNFLQGNPALAQLARSAMGTT